MFWAVAGWLDVDEILCCIVFRYAEKNTDAILEAKSKKNEDIEETVTKCK